MPIELFVDASSIDPNRPAHQSVPIWWKLESSLYPAQGWTDAAITLLQLWTFSVIQALDGMNDQKLVFMEGSYALDVHLLENTFLLQPKGEKGVFRIDIKDLIRELQSANRLIAQRLSTSSTLQEEKNRIERGISKLDSLLEDFSP